MIIVFFNLIIDAVNLFISKDISSGATGSKNMEAIREMCEQYPERCVIIEKDRVKGTSVNEKVV